MKEMEVTQAQASNISPKEIAVARDGIVLVVNPENPVNSLTTDQLRLIYTGKATNWQEVGGPDAPIIVLSRESSSGTFIFFQEHVLNKEDYTASARLLPGTSALIQAVASDKWAIAYVGLGFAAESQGSVKSLAVQAEGQAAPVAPSEATISSGEYAISRPLFFYTNGDAQGVAKKFVDFCLSPAGQDIVRKAGYVPVQ
jgi:phosphate transport system substrate-binding protein